MTVAQPANPYPKGIQVTGGGGGPQTWNLTWNPTLGTYTAGPNNLPIYTGSDFSSVVPGYTQQTGDKYTGYTAAGGVAGINPSATTQSPFGPSSTPVTPGSAIEQYTGPTSATFNNYTYDPATGYYIPSSQQGTSWAGGPTWWEGTLGALGVVGGAAGAAYLAGEGAVGAAGDVGGTIGSDVGGAIGGDVATSFPVTVPGAAVSTPLAPLPGYGVGGVDLGTGAAGSGGVGLSSTFSGGNYTDPLTGAGTDPSGGIPGSTGTFDPAAPANPSSLLNNPTGVLNSGIPIDPTTGLPSSSGFNLPSTGGGVPSVGGGNTGTGTGTGAGTNLNLGSGLNSLLGLGAVTGAGYALSSQLSRDAQTYAKQTASLAAPLGTLAGSQANQAVTGQLQPWQQSMINNMVQQEKAQAGQFLSDSGVANSGGNVQSTAGLDLSRQIDTNALIQAGQFQQTAISNYLNSYGAYTQQMNLSIQQQIQGDQEIEQLWSSILGSLSRGMFASNSGGTGGGTAGGGLNLASIGSSLSNVGSSLWNTVSSIGTDVGNAIESIL